MSARSLVLAMDLGSSSVRTALFAETGRRFDATIASRKYAVDYAADGGATLNPAALLRAARFCLTSSLRERRQSASLSRIPIVAVSGSAFWHSLLGLDRNGKPLTPIFTWADSRSAPDAARLRSELSERRIQLRSGCMLRAPFWPAKLRWLRRTERALWKRTARWVSPATWIFRELFGPDATSHSMASGTGLYDLRRRRWNAELSRLCGVNAEHLGCVKISSAAGRVANEDLRGAIVFAAIGDGAAGNLGSGATTRGAIAINIGTSAAAREIQPRAGRGSTNPARGLFKYLVDEDRAVLGGAISNAGNLHQWCLRELRLDKRAAERELTRETAATDALTLLPFWVSERSPTWPEHLPGVIAGLSQVTSAAEILRAANTSAFYRLAEIIEALPTHGRRKQVMVSGGILHSPASLEILADALGHDLHVSSELESSLRGAAVYALEKLGHRVQPLPPGKLVRHRPALTKKHRARRRAQNELERQLG